MEYTDVKKIPGILMFIDFEKAFDTIEWFFLQNVLKHFNFGPVIRHWVSTLFSDVESAVFNITIELMFAGVNMFLARLRFILARATGEG